MDENRDNAGTDGGTERSALYSAGALAYLGDAVFELLVREKLLLSGIGDPGRLNAMAAGYVRAPEQSRAVARVESYLTQEEAAVYRRGRNCHGVNIPRHASVAEYRRATGLEALFAHLYLDGSRERLYELFAIAFPDGEDCDTAKQ